MFLELDLGFLGPIEIEYNHYPAESSNDVKESMEIVGISINGRKISSHSEEHLFRITVKYNFKFSKIEAGLHTVEYILEQLIWSDLMEQKADNELRT